jgi:hypothetical protein
MENNVTQLGESKINRLKRILKASTFGLKVKNKEKFNLKSKLNLN